jgi:hypothetical protein
MNPKYVAIIKHNLDKLLSVGFITLLEQANWPIVVVPKKIDKFGICMDF